MKRHLKFVLGFLTAAVLLAQVQQPAIPPTICQGRLTLTTATPVTTADVTAATSLLFTPYTGNRCPVFDSTGGEIDRTFAELSIAVPATTSTMYDVWLFDNAGALALEVLAWTNDTTRATALTTQSGVLVKTGAITRRYLGSFRTTTVSGQTEDSLTKRYVWNYYNRVPRPLKRFETTASWTYSTAAYQQWNNSTSNQVDLVTGVAESRLWLAFVAATTNSAAGDNTFISIGEDSTTTADSNVIGQTVLSQASAAQLVPGQAVLSKFPTVGRHFYAALQQGSGANVTTWYGINSSAAKYQFGLLGWIEG